MKDYNSNYNSNAKLNYNSKYDSEKIKSSDLSLNQINPKAIFTSINDKLLEKITNDLEKFKHIFDFYSTIGFKSDAFNMTISGFFKFASDAEAISPKEFGEYFSNQEKDLNFNSTLNLMKNHKEESFDKKENEDKDMYNTSVHQTEKLKTGFSKLTKIPKSDLSLIFHNLCGVKNFNNSQKIKSQFDKNKGFNSNFESSFKGKSLDSKNLNKADDELKQLKMNFGLFLKSFEVIALKIYKGFSPSEALEIFIERNIQSILKGNTLLSLKKQYEDILSDLRREDIVRKKLK